VNFGNAIPGKALALMMNHTQTSFPRAGSEPSVLSALSQPIITLLNILWW